MDMPQAAGAFTAGLAIAAVGRQPLMNGGRLLGEALLAIGAIVVLTTLAVAACVLEALAWAGEHVGRWLGIAD